VVKGVAVVAAIGLTALVGGRELGLFDFAQDSPQSASAKADADGTYARLVDKGRWVREVTPICRRVGEWFDSQPTPQTPRELDRYLATLAAKNRSANSEIMALRPPDGARREIRTLRVFFKTDETLVSELLIAARQRDWTAYVAIAAKLERIAARESALFRRLGATACTLESRRVDTDASRIAT
jgi:hypothetical protein